MAEDLRKVSTNTFLGGMNKDLGDILLKPAQYRHAENFRILSDKNDQTGSLNNIKGNIKSIDSSLFKTSNVYAYSQITPKAGYYNVTVESITLKVYAKGKNIEEFYKTLKTEILKVFPKLTISYNRYWFLVYTISSQLNYNFNFDLVPDFVDYVGKEISLIVPTMDKLIQIGSTYLRDDLIIFTCPKLNPNKTGQIWRVNWVEEPTNLSSTMKDLQITPTPVLTLLYNNILNFSVLNPIRDCKTNYENETCSKIYFTDNNNPVRSFNYTETDCFSRPPEVLDFKGDIKLSKILLDNIGSGNLTSGAIQYVYTMYNKYYGETNLSPASNIISLGVGSEFAEDDKNFRGGKIGEQSLKSVTLKISNIDRRYDNLSVISIFYKDGTSAPIITRIFDEPIHDDEILVTDNGNTILEGLTEDYINIYKNQSLVAKTIEVKNNLLIAANISNDFFDIDYDARSYRFRSDKVCYIKNSNGTEENVSQDFKINGNDIDQFHDCITPNNGSYTKQKDGIAIGGSGPNISYKIKAINFQMAYSSKGECFEPKINQLFDSWLGDPDFVGNKNSLAGYGSTFISSQFRTYMRGETYRFGIVFYNKKGQRSPVKWIGDIQMPEQYASSSTPLYGTTSKYDIAYKDSNQIYAVPIYVEFEVNIPDNIRNDVSSFEIVRTQRLFADKTVLTQGVLTPTESADLEFIGDYWYINTFERDRSVEFDYQLVGFSTPEGIFDKNIECGVNDTLKLIKYQDMVINTSGYAFAYGSAIVTFDDYVGFDAKASNYLTLKIKDSINVLSSITKPYTISTCPKKFLNVCEGLQGTTDHPKGLGCSKNILKTDVSYDFLDLVMFNDRLAIGSYRREQPAQYGGNSYEDRLKNKYVTTGAYGIISDSSKYYKKTFGGDTFINFFDLLYQYLILPYVDAESSGRAINVAFPVESTINLSMRADKPYYKALDYKIQESATNYVGANHSNYFQAEDLFQYNPAYSRDADAFFMYPDDNRISKNKQKDCKIIVSSRKRNGELIDSWVNFKISDYIEINTTFGEINKIINHKNNIYCFQNNGIGSPSIDEKSVVQAQDSSNIILGTGGVLQRYDYIDTTNGTKHQFSVIPSDTAIYYFDQTDRQLKVLSQENISLSNMFGLKSYLYNLTAGDILNEDNPINSNGIHGYFDDRYNEVVFTFLNGEKKDTIAFNEDVKAFTSFYSFTPRIYIKHYSKILSSDTSVNSPSMYLHNFGDYNTFYNTVFDSKISLLINENYGITKVFDNLSTDCEIEIVPTQIPKGDIFHPVTDLTSYDENILKGFFTKIRCYNNYQNTDWYQLIYQDIVPAGKQINYSRRERLQSLSLPRNIFNSPNPNNKNIFEEQYLSDYSREFRERLRDKSLNIDLIFENPNKYKLSTNFIRVGYRRSAR